MRLSRQEGPYRRGYRQGWDHLRGSYASDSSDESGSELSSRDMEPSYQDEVQERVVFSAGRGSQGDPPSDTESARLHRLGSQLTSTGTMKYRPYKAGPAFRDHWDEDHGSESEAFFVGNKKSGSKGVAYVRDPYASSYDTDESSGDDHVARRRPKRNERRKKWNAEPTVEDILTGELRLETKHKKEKHARRENVKRQGVPEELKDELLIYLLNEHMKLKAIIEEEQDSRCSTPQVKKSPKGKHEEYRELKDLTTEDLRLKPEIWGRNFGPSSPGNSHKHVDMEAGKSPGSSKAKKGALSSGRLNQEKKRTKNGTNSMLSEATLLQSELEELIDDLETTERFDVGVNTPTTGFDLFGYRETPERVDAACSAAEEEEDWDYDQMVMPVKVPIRPPMPEHCDVGVATDASARERDLHMYERLNREIDESKFEDERAHQTDNTRIANSGVSWEITESYLKNEERRMLQEKRRAELLDQLKKGPEVKSDTLQDHYNRWAQKKNSFHKVIETPTFPEKECPQETADAKVTTDGHVNVACLKGPHGVRNVFRRNTGSNSPPMSTRSEPIPASCHTPHHSHLRTALPLTEGPQDVYIKGTWNPRTGALKISNDVAKSDSTKILDRYVNFLKQSPGNLTQEPVDKEACKCARRQENQLDNAEFGATEIEEIPIRMEEKDIEPKEQLEGMPEPEKFYDIRPPSPSESLASSPRSMSPRSSSSSDNPWKQHDDEYMGFPAVPMQSPPSHNSMPGPIYALGFRDPYYPPKSPHPYTFHSSSFNASRNQMDQARIEHHHHYHYHRPERPKKCKSKTPVSNKEAEPRKGKCHKKKGTKSKKKVTCKKSGAQEELPELEEEPVVSTPTLGTTLDTTPVKPEPNEVGTVTSILEVRNTPLSTPQFTTDEDQYKEPFVAIAPETMEGKPASSAFPGLYDEVVVPKPNSTLTMADLCYLQMQQNKDPQMKSQEIRSPRFGKEQEAGVLPIQEDISDGTFPVSYDDIRADNPFSKGSDLYKVTTYYAPTESIAETNSSVRAESDDTIEEGKSNKLEKCFPFFMGCCDVPEDIRSDDIRSTDNSGYDSTVYQGSPTSQVDKASEATVPNHEIQCDSRLLYPQLPNVFYRGRNRAPNSRTGHSPTPYRHVFGRRCRSRNGEPKTCTSPLVKLQQSEACEQLGQTECNDMCNIYFQTNAETSDQFTFREPSENISQQDVSSPMFKTRLIYVGGN